ncbi:MAG: ATP synthase F1 subunit delta [Oscillospiraceae bacterium]|jgi:F-type H+-transporting ATPase subunit delta|nr:ATP synthase F1 subunit delta [Oscillospiraceae bacterium]
MESLLFSRYAEAVFEVAKTQDLDEIRSQLEFLNKVLKDKEIMDFFVSFSVPRQEKLKVIDEIFKDFDSVVVGFFKLLIEKLHVKFFERVWLKFKAFYNDFRGIEDVQVFSVVKLTEEQLQSVKGLLEKKIKKTVEIENLLDGTLVGGLVFKYGGKTFDASLVGNLRKLKLQVAQMK